MSARTGHRRYSPVVGIVLTAAWLVTDSTFDVNNSLLAYLWLTFAYACLVYRNTYRSSLEISGSIGIFLLYVVPFFAYLVGGVQVEYLFYALALLVLGLILVIARSSSRRPTFLDTRPIALSPLIAICIATIAQWMHPVAFAIIYALSLISFEHLCRVRTATVRVRLVLLAYAASLLVFALFNWSGFGRLVVGTYFLIPIAIASYYQHITLRPLLLYPLLVAASIFATFLRFGQYSNISSLADDSGSHHIAIMTELAAQNISAHPGAIWDQFALLVLNWAPRSLWEDKPIGIGYSFVDDYIGRHGFGEGFSVSLGLFGEHLYLNRDFWFASFLLTAVAVIALRTAIGKVTGPANAPVIAFDVSLLSLLWGGMATFGSRVWFLVIPMVLYVLAANTFGYGGLLSRRAFRQSRHALLPRT